MQAEAADAERRLKNVLTEKSLQTAMYYWLELRGNMYSEYMARFTEGEGGGGSVVARGWRTFLSNLLSSPPEEVIIEKVVKKPRGGSGTNPYLAARKVVSYTEVIEPMTLGRRILDIRAQLAAELFHDLELIESENERDLELIESENERVQQFYQDELRYGIKEATRLRLRTWQPVVDTDAINSTDTPYRSSLYLAVLALVTKVSLERYKKELRIVGDKHTLAWLDKIGDANLTLSGNDLIEAMLNGPMVLINDGKDRARPKVVQPLRVAADVVQPLRVAAEVMALRVSVVREFKGLLAGVPQEHQALIQGVLERQLRARASGDSEDMLS
ncbi:hypothetical protein JKP88DRAFT_304479 [Tribonema minus]|uniref:Uncharacterized protein n=1 Tax=Tribonema minus TaxID=303371 RepID=A0A835Z7Q1_9STRA|nr:hypothetical protein JKP88DRAFT_304479 [Tribonema minus]